MQYADNHIVDLATALTAAWLANPNTRTSADDVPGFIRSMHESLSKLMSGGHTAGDVDAAKEYVRAVTVRKSLANKDHIVSMIDGKPYKALRRHLSSHGLTPERYRARYGLKPSYPMVAENYSEQRREAAKALGLGRVAVIPPAPKSARKDSASGEAPEGGATENNKSPAKKRSGGTIGLRNR